MTRIAVAVTPGRTLSPALERVRFAERAGCDSVWLSQLPNERDTGLVLAAYAAATERVGLGTFVLPIYTRHPTAMVQLAEEKRAVYDAGYDGWVLWHPGSQYDIFVPALEKEMVSRKKTGATAAR